MLPLEALRQEQQVDWRGTCRVVLGRDAGRWPQRMSKARLRELTNAQSRPACGSDRTITAARQYHRYTATNVFQAVACPHGETETGSSGSRREGGALSLCTSKAVSVRANPVLMRHLMNTCSHSRVENSFGNIVPPTTTQLQHLGSPSASSLPRSPPPRLPRRPPVARRWHGTKFQDLPSGSLRKRPPLYPPAQKNVPWLELYA